jgi:hypothetical protein
VRALALLLSLAAAAMAAGCQLRPSTPMGRAGPAEVGSPFSPAMINLHPLTRIDRAADGKPMIITYLDVRDAWDDATKAIGKLAVHLYRPGGGPVAGLDQQELTWDLDLSDLDRNSRLYDPVTHMYRLQLLDAPAWILAEPGREQPRFRLRAILDTFGPSGEARRLEDDLLIGQ